MPTTLEVLKIRRQSRHVEFFFRDYKFKFNCYIAGVFPATARPFIG